MAKGLRRRGREPEVKEKVVRIRDTNEKSKPGIVSRLKRPQNTEEATSKTSGKIYSSVQKEREKVSKSTSRGKRRNIHPLSASFNGRFLIYPLDICCLVFIFRFLKIPD